jgi:hypothetical protein
MADHRWTDKLDRLLLRRRQDGFSAAQIAAELSAAGFPTTRNAVLGRFHRLIKKRPSSAPPSRIDDADLRPIVPERAFTGRPLALDDHWPSKACRFPLFGKEAVPRGVAIFCGAAVSRPPYCDDHRLLAYRNASADDLADPDPSNPATERRTEP